MKVSIYLLTLPLFLVATGTVALAVGPLYSDDFEGGLNKDWTFADLEGKGKWEVVQEKGNKVLKVDATGAWSGASVDKVASLKAHKELWATDRVKVEAATGEIELGLLTNPTVLNGNWYLDLRIGQDLMIDEAGVLANSPVAPVPIQAGKWYRMKIAVIKETFYGKMWAEDEAEPKDWMLNAKVTSHLDEDGAGVLAYHTIAYFDDFIVADSEDSLAFLAVSPKERLTTMWGRIKAQ